MKNYPFSNENACLVLDDLTSQYFIKSSLEEGYLVLADKKTCFIDARSYLGVKDNLVKDGIDVKLLKDISDVKDFLTEIKAKNLYLDFSKTTVKAYNEFLLWGFEIKDSSEIISEMRSQKTSDEIDKTIVACEIAEKTLYSALESLKKGITELELKEIIEEKIIEHGAEGTSFETIVAFSKNSAVPHHKSNGTRLEKDMPVLIDMGAKYKGYSSDITRTMFYGNPPKDFIDRYNLVLKANLTAEKSIKCGDMTDNADGYARDVLEKEGLAKYFTHSLGHGIGLEVHEYPFLSPKKKNELKENMLFTIEPGVYFDGEYGIRIEDTVLLTKDGIKRLFTDSKELMIIKEKN